MKRAVGVLVIGGLLLAATPEPFGGWAVVTLLHVPEHLEVGTPTTLRFKIRVHGRTPVEGREPSLILEDAGLPEDEREQERVRARPGKQAGVYAATFTPRETGDLAVTIDPDLGNLKAELLPFRVVASDNGAVALSPTERGRQLFVAKGCAACHAKLEDDPMHGYRYADFGPSLAGRTFPPDFLRLKLRNPAAVRGEWPNDVVMPRLELIGPEIEALVTYLGAREPSPSG